MKKFLWLKLAVLLLTGFFSLSVALLWFFATQQNPTSPYSLFLSYFTFGVLLSSLVCFLVFLSIFFYLKSYLQASEFLLGSFQQMDRREKKKMLGRLARMDNKYLDPIRKTITDQIFSNNKETRSQSPAKDPHFSEILHQATEQSHRIYPDLQIEEELNADIRLPVFSESIFQSLWELIKNTNQALPAGQKKGKLRIRTFKQSNWFCCELEDNGEGMKESEIPQASRLYFSTKENSVGAGLTLVESVLSRLGGIMKLHSSDGKGFLVSLLIPLDYIDHVQNLKHSGRKRNQVPPSHPELAEANNH